MNYKACIRNLNKGKDVCFSVSQEKHIAVARLMKHLIEVNAYEYVNGSPVFIMCPSIYHTLETGKEITINGFRYQVEQVEVETSEHEAIKQVCGLCASGNAGDDVNLYDGDCKRCPFDKFTK